MAEAPSIARFVFPQIQDNPNGWGPCEVPVQFKDTPYQPFSKDDRLGKVADWTNNLYQDRRTANKYGTAYGSGQMYTYYHEQDESSFHLVDSSRPQRTIHHKPRGRQMQSKIRRDREKREERKLGGRQQVPFKKNREKSVVDHVKCHSYS
jgi:translation initiation factor 3 subunit D